MRSFMLCLLLSACGTEATFMGVCREGDDVVLPRGANTNSLVCDVPERIVWPQKPITIALDDLGDYAESARSAVKLWNDHVPGLFAIVVGDADVSMGIGAVRGEVRGTTSFRYENTRLKSRVELLGPSDITSAYWILAHELGHVAGLAHDKTPKSLMYTNLDLGGGLLGDSDALPMFVISSTDRDALHKQYP